MLRVQLAKFLGRRVVSSFQPEPADMATEVERIKWTKNYTTFNQSNITGCKTPF